jgi:hypothetical protein
MKYILMFILIATSGCATFSPNRFEAKLYQDSTVQKAGGESHEIKRGETVVLGEKPTLIQAPGYVGVLVLPSSDYKGLVDIDLKPVKSYGGEAFNRKFNQSVNEVISEINEIQLLVAKSKPQEALDRALLLQTKYPQLTYIQLLKASAFVMLHEEKKALQALEIAIKDFPENKQVQELYVKLGGKRSIASEKKKGDLSE